MEKIVTIAEVENTQPISLNYLSNLFTRFNFINEIKDANPQAYTDKYFDELKLFGDTWIEFFGKVLTDNTEEESRAIQIQHKRAPEDSIDETAFDAAGHAKVKEIKMYIHDDGNGNITFSYSPSQGKEV